MILRMDSDLTIATSLDRSTRVGKRREYSKFILIRVYHLGFPLRVFISNERPFFQIKIQRIPLQCH